MKKLVTGALAVVAVIALGAPSARADVVAVYLGGYGGLSSHPSGDARSTSSSLTPGLGLELGARLLIFDGYINRAEFFDGRGVTRAIAGLRTGLDIAGARLILRAGAGVVFEQGGALTGADARDRHGLVARAGVAIERRLTPKVFAIGVAVDGEYFALDTVGSEFSSLNVRNYGSDVLASLRLQFEVGI